MPKPSWSFGEGEAIAPDLVAIDHLGGGHRCEVYLAWNERLHARVVVKILRPHQNKDPKAIRDLGREADALERLAHPLLVRGFGAHLEGPRPHLVLEHVDGPTLRHHIKGLGAMRVDHVARIAEQIAGVLHYMHEEGTLHLDVKPGNIILAQTPKLIDLSLARTFEVAERLKNAVGTRAYRAPEQSDPVELGPPGPASDVWGLGATLFYALTGAKPFEANDVENPALEGHRTPWPDHVPPTARVLVDACLAPEPETRPSSSEVAEGARMLQRGGGRPGRVKP